MSSPAAPKEYWEHMEGYPLGFEVSSKGRVRINYGDRVSYVKLQQTSDGYQTVSILGKQPRVHTLVATAFIPNPENKKVVNHIDGNKSNNCVANLEWSTYAENTLHGYRTGQYTGKQVLCKELNKVFTTLQAAEAILGIPRYAIEAACKSGEHCFGYHFEFLDSNSYVYPSKGLFISAREVIECSKTMSSIDQLRRVYLDSEEPSEIEIL